MNFEGIVIRRTSYNNEAAMVTVLTKEKLRSFLCKGVLKITSKNSSSVNLFTKSNFTVFKGKEGDWLRSGEIISSYPNIINDFNKLAALDFISEITNSFIGTNDTKEIYDFLSKSLDLLNTNFSTLTVCLVYFAKVLKASGYGLDVDSCCICGKKEGIVAVSLKDGGFICDKCFNGLNHQKYDSRKLKIFRYIFKVDLDNYGKINFDDIECKNIIFEIYNFLNMNSQIELKSLALLNEI